MIQHKRSGFTVVELIVVIVVVALLATITTIAYRSTQASARDEKRTADVLMLKAAIEEYYTYNGHYPMPTTTCADPGNSLECFRNEPWEMLVAQGYLSKVPTPDAKSPIGSFNINNGKSNYGWTRRTGNTYAIYVPLETHPEKHCKIGRNVGVDWWAGAPLCDF